MKSRWFLYFELRGNNESNQEARKNMNPEKTKTDTLIPWKFHEGPTESFHPCPHKEPQIKKSTNSKKQNST